MEALDDADIEGVEHRESLDIPDLGTHAPELMETRDLIDELDRDIVRLLARRAKLSKRAGSLKAERGKPVRDPIRERALLELRKQWAREHNLEADAMVDIFTAILRFSRTLQTE